VIDSLQGLVLRESHGEANRSFISRLRRAARGPGRNAASHGRLQGAVAGGLASDRTPLLPLLVDMTEDKDAPVRLAVVSSLADVRNKTTTGALRKMLNDPVPEVSFAAAKALWGYLTAEMRHALRMMHTSWGKKSLPCRRCLPIPAFPAAPAPISASPPSKPRAGAWPKSEPGCYGSNLRPRESTHSHASSGLVPA